MMEAQTKKATWVAPILIAALVLLTLLATVAWMQTVSTAFGAGLSPMTGTSGMGGMMGAMMEQTGNGSTGPGTMMGGMMGGDMPKDCQKQHAGQTNTQQHQAMTEKCNKTMGANHDKMHQQMQGATGAKTL